jgi:hypothetical protein
MLNINIERIYLTIISGWFVVFVFVAAQVRGQGKYLITLLSSKYLVTYFDVFIICIIERTLCPVRQSQERGYLPRGESLGTVCLVQWKRVHLGLQHQCKFADFSVLCSVFFADHVSFLLSVDPREELRGV